MALVNLPEDGSRKRSRRDSASMLGSHTPLQGAAEAAVRRHLQEVHPVKIAGRLDSDRALSVRVCNCNAGL